MKTFVGWLVSKDIFGEPISVNFKGYKEFKTRLGAVFTIFVYTFLLFILVSSLIDVFRYKDPKITQVSLRVAKI